jgi:small subunit ribosomal protein S6
MAFYENVFIARQDISAAQVDTLADQFTTVLSENGGAVKKKEYWGLKSLSYRIKKNRKGHYVLLNIDAPPAAVHEMERQMRINEDILRFLTVRVDELEEGPSAMLQSRGREDRPRRYDDRPRRYEDRGPRHEPAVQAEPVAVEE